MLKTSPILVTQSLIELADNEFGGGDCGEDEAGILFKIFASKDPTRTGDLNPIAKKAFNFL